MSSFGRLGTGFNDDSDDPKKNKMKQGVPLVSQEVRDAQGRQRLHGIIHFILIFKGAFQGGFSAGYYNTVGSKEGWTPSQFQSKRNAKNASSLNQSAQDFMDEEDIMEFGDELSKKAQFESFGFTQTEFQRKSGGTIPSSSSQDGISFNSNPIGWTLMKKLGWKEGAPIGKRQISVTIQNPKLVFSKDTTINNSIDTFGLGYDPHKDAPEFSQKKEDEINAYRNRESSVKDKSKGGFGTGIFDYDQDMDLDFDMPEMNYNTTIMDEDEDEKKRPLPVIETKPTVKAKKLPPAPFPPPGFQPKPLFLKQGQAKRKELTTDDRRDLLEEVNVTGSDRSIFSFINQKNQERLQSFISKATTVTPAPVHKEPVQSFLVPAAIAQAALKGFMPFGDRPEKQTRYKEFLQNIIKEAEIVEDKGIIGPKKMSDDDARESREFAKAAMIYRPMADMISARFTNELTDKEREALPKQEKVKIVYGKATRSIHKFKPNKLVCRRFGVVFIDDSDDEPEDVVDRQQKEALNSETMKKLITERDRLIEDGKLKSDLEVEEKTEREVLTKDDMMAEFGGGMQLASLDAPNVEEELVLPEKPSMDLFKAIFADSDSDEEETEVSLSTDDKNKSTTRDAKSEITTIESSHVPLSNTKPVIPPMISNISPHLPSNHAPAVEKVSSNSIAKKVPTVERPPNMMKPSQSAPNNAQLNANQTENRPKIQPRATVELPPHMKKKAQTAETPIKVIPSTIIEPLPQSEAISPTKTGPVTKGKPKTEEELYNAKPKVAEPEVSISFRPTFSKPIKRDAKAALNKPRRNKSKVVKIMSFEDDEEEESNEKSTSVSSKRLSAADFM
ncbi:hypothetical protein HDV02_001030 [Globomyces sp. JEL0801]|nr:hypothetical protein HDV02_001030 [Globomyces sp. JEL0801]